MLHGGSVPMPLPVGAPPFRILHPSRPPSLSPTSPRRLRRQLAFPLTSPPRTVAPSTHAMDARWRPRLRPRTVDGGQAGAAAVQGDPRGAGARPDVAGALSPLRRPRPHTHRANLHPASPSRRGVAGHLCPHLRQPVRRRCTPARAGRPDRQRWPSCDRRCCRPEQAQDHRDRPCAPEAVSPLQLQSPPALHRPPIHGSRFHRAWPQRIPAAARSLRPRPLCVPARFHQRPLNPQPLDLQHTNTACTARCNPTVRVRGREAPHDTADIEFGTAFLHEPRSLKNNRKNNRESCDPPPPGPHPLLTGQLPPSPSPPSAHLPILPPAPSAHLPNCRPAAGLRPPTRTAKRLLLGQ